MNFKVWKISTESFLDEVISEYNCICNSHLEKDLLFFEEISIEGKKFYNDSDILKFKYLEELNKEIDLIGSFHFNRDDLSYEIDIYNNERYICLNYVGNGIFRDFEKIGTIQENPELTRGETFE
jgi:hypothetical protein